MPVKLLLSADKNVLETKLEGYCNPKEIKDGIVDAIDIQKKHGTLLFLTDCRSFKSDDSNPMFNAYKLVQLLEALEADYGSKDAIVAPVSTDTKGNMAFFEVAALPRRLPGQSEAGC